MHKVLLAEDDVRLAELVKDYLQEYDFTVRIESAGDKVVEGIADWQPDLVILDIMLPGQDGLSICKEARDFYSGPILMLTARNADLDQVLGLEFGADDYVVKPAEPRVLLARVRALLRRVQIDKHQNIPQEENKDECFGALTLHRSAREVSLDNKPVRLSSHEYDLLLTFVDHAGDVLSREYLFQKIYNREYDGLDRSIDVRISQLRKKLGDNSEHPTKIKTIWGRGYLFVQDAW